MNEQTKIKKILILRTEHIGDYVLALPAIKTLRKNFPKAKITIVVGSWNKELAKATPYTNKIVIFDNPLVRRALTYFSLPFVLLFNLKRLIKFIRRLKKERHDLAVIFSSRRFNRLFQPFIDAETKLSGIKLRTLEEDERIRCLKVLEPLRLKKIYHKAKINISKKDKEHVKRLFKKYKIEKKKKVIIHPLTPLKEKNWPLENYAKLINEISKEKDLVFLIVGSEKDKSRLTKLYDNLKYDIKNKVINLAGRLNLIQLLELIERSNLFLGSDSGPMHLAKLTKTPIIALFSITNPKIWGPKERKDLIIKKDRIENIKVNEVKKFIVDKL